MTARFERRAPDQLTPEQALLREKIAGGPRAQGRQLFALTDEQGRLNGPFAAMLLSPQVGDALQSLGAAVRYETELSDRAREIAILAVAAHWDSAFERYAHEPLARAAGLDDAEVEALRADAPVGFSDPGEAAVHRCAVALLHAQDLTDDEYAEAVERLGERALFELTTLIGYYATLALQLRVFRVGTPETS